MENPAVRRLENVMKRKKKRNPGDFLFYFFFFLKWLLLLLLLLYKKRTMTGLGEGLYIFSVSLSISYRKNIYTLFIIRPSGWMTLHEILVLVHFFFLLLLSLFSLLFDFVVNKSTENGAMKLESYFHQFLLFLESNG